jgi:hypothetical protein
MEEEKIETTDSTKGEEEKEVVVDTTTEEEEEPKFTDAERKAFARAKVAEAKVKELKAQLDKGTSKSSGDSEFGQKAYLIANGIKGAKEFDFVKAELKASGQDLDTLLENDYFKSKLEKFRGLQQTADATPTGKRSSGVATESVEYWMSIAGSKAENLDKVPKDMQRKVVNAIHDKEQKTGHFYNS